MRFRGELCDSAKKGEVCIDDLCRGADITLCGFCELYESCIAEDAYGDEDWTDDFDDKFEFEDDQ